ncbi:hypothetical protein MVES1_000065 [Malassezia vespertilionis]|uniref:uncharacterized protein n=1 Tax=Malassezia vespertilionis TaxID=2020962 RepID=UPI0024B1A865|nr:uncharacterized protein MVES1_000065 [Malassezia vespertilionis]WFD04741.1 hypothetical protein MVES1_000065 [Malassezia vespertilionis]
MNFVRGSLRAAHCMPRLYAVRTYATAAPLAKTYTPKVVKVLPYQKTRKALSDRKAYLYAKYRRILQENELVLLLETENVSVPLMKKIRAQVANVKFPDSDRERLEAAHGGSWSLPTTSVLLARTGILRPVCKDDSAQVVQELGPYLHGQLTMLVCPILSPEYVGKVLRAIEKPIREATRAIDSKSGKKVPLMRPLAAVAERTKLIDAASIPMMTKLPNRAMLHAQLVGLLSAPGQQLTGIISQAGGVTLAATLDAHRRSLEKDA